MTRWLRVNRMLRVGIGRRGSARFCSVLLTLWPDHRDGLIYQISQFDMRKHINIIVSLPLGVSIFRQYDIRVSE
jgi:hypothetical protein